MNNPDYKYKFSENLFWDIDIKTLDMEKNSPYVIQRTLEYALTMTGTCCVHITGWTEFYMKQKISVLLTPKLLHTYLLSPTLLRLNLDVTVSNS